MSFSEEMLSQFDQYSSGGMSATDRQDFESRLAGDQEFSQLFQEYLSLQDGIDAFGYDQVAGNIAEWEAEVIAEERTVTIGARRWYLIAASISVILVAAIGFWKLNSNESAQELYAAYYEAYPDVITNRGGNSNELNKALYAYESGVYAEAESMLKEFSQDDGNYREAQFYLGQTFMASGKTDKAIEIYRVLKDDTGFTLKEASAWYLALS